MSLEGELLLSGVRVPHLHRLIKAPRHDAFAVGAERYAGDGAPVALEGELLLSRLRVPHLHLWPGGGCPLIIPPRASRRDAFAVGGKRHAPDSAGVALEGK